MSAMRAVLWCAQQTLAPEANVHESVSAGTAIAHARHDRLQRTHREDGFNKTHWTEHLYLACAFAAVGGRACHNNGYQPFALAGMR
jgi:rhamnogalacturonyl hydrolase YesR